MNYSNLILRKKKQTNKQTKKQTNKNKNKNKELQSVT